MDGVGLTCLRARGSRCAGARCRCCWRGCTIRGRGRTTSRLPSTGRSPTGWWPSSGCRSRAGGAGQFEPGGTIPPNPPAIAEGRLLAVMLEDMRISGLGVIDDALLELSSGFTVVTGETGAGKTMVVTGLGLMFGGRADPARVRPGAERATVEGRLRIDPGGRVAQQVLEAGGELDDEGGTLIVSRSVSAEGRSRAHASGRSVPVSLLTYLADDLVAVHGQADQQQLLRTARQREALDEFAGPAFVPVLADYQRTYARHREVLAELNELTARARERALEAEDLQRSLEEIERAEPTEGEDAALLAEEERLAHADALHAAATTAHAALLGDPADGSYEGGDAITLLGGARQALDAVAAHDPALAGLAGRLSEAVYILSDIATELASYVESLDSDPARLAVVQERRAELNRLIRAYGGRVASPGPAVQEHSDPAVAMAPGAPAAAARPAAEAGAPYLDGGAAPAAPAAVPDLASVLAWAEQARRRLTELAGDDDRISALAGEEERLGEAVRDLGGQLTALRKEAAERFAAGVTTELTALAMPNAKVSVVVT